MNNNLSHVLLNQGGGENSQQAPLDGSCFEFSTKNVKTFILSLLIDLFLFSFVEMNKDVKMLPA